MLCPGCGERVVAQVHASDGFSACPSCGRVLDDVAFSSDVPYTRGADGEGQLVGQYVPESGRAKGVNRIQGGKLWNVKVRGVGLEGEGGGLDGWMDEWRNSGREEGRVGERVDSNIAIKAQRYTCDFV